MWISSRNKWKIIKSVLFVMTLWVFLYFYTTNLEYTSSKDPHVTESKHPTPHRKSRRGRVKAHNEHPQHRGANSLGTRPDVENIMLRSAQRHKSCDWCTSESCLFKDITVSRNRSWFCPSFSQIPIQNGTFDSSLHKTLAPYHGISNSEKYFDCKKLFDGDQDEITRLKEREGTLAFPGPKDYIEMTENCDKFIHDRGYIMDTLSEEANFPIAYSISMYKDLAQTERLLRAIYRPQNYYCIHVDVKAHLEVEQGMRKIASCFDNVFIASRQLNICWGTYSIVEMELICMKDLLRYKSWKYFINLTGQEFPLRTNAELVKILKIFNGANSIEGSIKRNTGTRLLRLRKIPPLPFEVNFTTGQMHIAAQRGFIEFIIYSNYSRTLLDNLKHTHIPDEVFFTTLNYNPQLGAPGSYIGEKENDNPMTPPGQYPRNPYLARYKNWSPRFALHQEEFNRHKCYGKLSRKICIFGYGDLTSLTKRPELFANKFHMTFQPEAYSCMEELIRNRTLQQIDHNYVYDLEYYRNVGFIHTHV